MPGTLAAISIVAADLRAAAAFYRMLGVDVDDPTADAVHHETTLPSGVRLMWDAETLVRELETGWQRTSGGQAVTLAFEYPSPAEVDAAHAAVVEAGHRSHKEPWDAFWGQRYAQVVDPDGTVVDLFAPLPA